MCLNVCIFLQIKVYPYVLVRATIGVLVVVNCLKEACRQQSLREGTASRPSRRSRETCSSLRPRAPTRRGAMAESVLSPRTPPPPPVVGAQRRNLLLERRPSSPAPRPAGNFSAFQEVCVHATRIKGTARYVAWLGTKAPLQCKQRWH